MLPRDSIGGFSLIELIIMISLISIIMAISLPYFNNWKKSLNYQQAARQMTSMLREAHSTAISSGVAQMVVFKPNSSSFQTIPYDNVLDNWKYGSPTSIQILPTDVTMKSTISGTSNANVYAQMNTNGLITLQCPATGAISDPYISVNDGATQKYLIKVSPVGRIYLQQK